MPTKHEIFSTTPEQKFSGSIETKSYQDRQHPEKIQTVKQLTAELNREGFILLDTEQPSNPDLGTVANQPILATIEVKPGDSTINESPKLLHLARIDDPSDPAFDDFRHLAGRFGYAEGSLLLQYVDSGTVSTAYIPDNYQFGFVGRGSNLQWISYPAGKDERFGWSPIAPTHRLGFFRMADGIGLRNFYDPIQVKTRATDEHQAVVEAEISQHTEPSKTQKSRRLGSKLLRFSR